MNLQIFDDGPTCFRLKIVMSILSNRPIRICNIRNRSKCPGVTDYEVNFLQLINLLSNGAVININDTGCVVNFSPGSLIGGEHIFDCSNERGLGYFLEPLLILSPFTKTYLSLKLTGVTNNSIDPSVDIISQTWLPLLKKFLPPASSSSLKLEIKKRGIAPKGGGLVVLSSKPAQQISPIQLVSSGKVYRVRGVAWTCRVSPAIASQLMHGAKGLLNSFLSDVYINLDQRKREVAGECSGFGIVLWAETKEGIFYSAEATSDPEGSKQSQPVIPTELGNKAASHLLNQIYLGGCVDQSAQAAALTMMALEGGHNASQLLISAPTPYTVSSLRLIRQCLGVTFDLAYKEMEESAQENGSEMTPPPLIATCFGSGLKNVNLSIL
uniref:RNA 3'-terminal phosphate cyclase-like protein n=2 Tax=Schistocephalus solidus TaxID=70667 RepID=A0A0X3PGX6_SCHSO